VLIYLLSGVCVIASKLTAPLNKSEKVLVKETIVCMLVTMHLYIERDER
jgi:hypothetical protein